MLGVLLSPIGRAGLGLIAALALFIAVYMKGRSDGYNHAVARIEQQNRAALERAERIRREQSERCARTPADDGCLRDPWTRNE